MKDALVLPLASLSQDGRPHTLWLAPRLKVVNKPPDSGRFW